MFLSMDSSDIGLLANNEVLTSGNMTSFESNLLDVLIKSADINK